MSTRQTPLRAHNPLVSCLCLTQGRVPLLRRAVACFLRQTYAPRELIILFQLDDRATRDYLATLSDPTIRTVGLPASPRLTTGQLRNRSVEEACGHYIAIWDDDDWHGPTRLAEQIGALRQTGRSGCVLFRLFLYDELTQAAFLSARRLWEGTLVAERAAVPAFPDLQRGEDTPVIDSMRTDDKLVKLTRRPGLYVYVCHDANTSGRAHWETFLLPYAQTLSPDKSAQVRTILKNAGTRE